MSPNVGRVHLAPSIFFVSCLFVHQFRVLCPSNLPKCGVGFIRCSIVGWGICSSNVSRGDSCLVVQLDGTIPFLFLAIS
uniref:Peptidase S1 domain-containing protein n=1 Tax=Aegilops tauschii subsp. strangulata TaxID=200361 RepID=A0A453SM09_AEGTS